MAIRFSSVEFLPEPTFAVATVVLLVGYVGSRRLVTRQVEFGVPNLPESFDGFRIVQLSDFHVGPHTPRRFLERVMRATQTLKPDVIAVTGDLVDDRPEDVARIREDFRGVRCPARRRTSFREITTSTPDGKPSSARCARQNWERARQRIDAASARRATRLRLWEQATRQAVGAVTSRAAPDVSLALEDVPADVTVIAFAHNPSLWPALAARGVSLTLSGHTQWGEFALPKLGWSLAFPFLETRWRPTWSATPCSTSALEPATGAFPSVSAPVPKSRR